MMNGKSDDAADQTSRHVNIVRSIQNMIVTGELAEGVRLPEKWLCEQLGVSRTPLREAFKVLAAQGIITLLPNRGAVVVDHSVAEIDDAIDVLAALEMLAGRRAAAEATERDIARIEALHMEMAERFRERDLPAYFRLNQAIHQEIVDIPRNEALSATYASLSTRFHRFRYVGNTNSERWKRALWEHELILEHLRDRDGPLLSALLNSHLRNGWALVKETLTHESSVPDRSRARHVNSRRNAVDAS
jgi:DNA-binding GntR family transcriptional regulator